MRKESLITERYEAENDLSIDYCILTMNYDERNSLKDQSFYSLAQVLSCSSSMVPDRGIYSSILDEG